MGWEMLRGLSRNVVGRSCPLGAQTPVIEVPSCQQESALKALGNEGLFLFSSLDTDGDLHISPEEFKPIAEKLTGIAPAWPGPEGTELPPLAVGAGLLRAQGPQGLRVLESRR